MGPVAEEGPEVKFGSPDSWFGRERGSFAPSSGQERGSFAFSFGRERRRGLAGTSFRPVFSSSAF